MKDSIRCLCTVAVGIGLLLLFWTAGGAAEKARGVMGKPAKSSAYEDRKMGVLDGNKVVTLFYNFGGIGNWQDMSGRQNCGIYPKGSNRAYIAEFTPVIGTEVLDIFGNTVHIFSDGMVCDRTGIDISPEGYQWGFEPLPGYADPDQDEVAMSDNPDSWPESWPDKPYDWDGFWNGQYGKYVRADLETYFRMNDYYNDEFAFFPDPSDTTVRGLGLEVEVRGYQWAHVAAEDIIIWTYWITNTGTTDYEKMVFGMYGDADVGDDGDQHDDDADFDIDNDIVYQYDHDSWSAVKGGFVPAHFGYKYLESPGDPTDGVDNDGDGMIDESQDDGIDNDGDWNAATDDVGSDGIGPDWPNYPGPDPDGTEGNGRPDPGEPNYEYTDNDESDQIGLTSFNAAPWPTINASDDEDLWNRTRPEFFSEIMQTVDLTFLYGSGYFPLPAGEKRKFAIALLLGEDYDDIIRNAVTMQAIYDADYNFAKPPEKPTVTAVPGDHKVTLYWDKRAEEMTWDPIYGHDLEGYAIFRSTDPGFNESWIITDAYGNKTFDEPIAQFDLNNGLKGPHPKGFNGIHFNMGKDTGLAYQWTDTTVENGQTYYYAVCSYDKGYYDGFYELGISDLPNLQSISPAISSKTIEIDETGRAVTFDRNTVMVTPDAPAAGFIPPDDMDIDNGLVTQEGGFGTGFVSVNILDPMKVPDGWHYQISIDDTSWGASSDTVKTFTVLNQHIFMDTISADTAWILLDRANLVPDSVRVTGLGGNPSFHEGVDFEVVYSVGNVRALPGGSLVQGQPYEIHYQHYPVLNSPFVKGQDFNPYFDGLQILVHDDSLYLDTTSYRWTIGDCNYSWNVDLFGTGDDYPADFELRFEGSVGDSVREDARPTVHTHVPFVLWSPTEDRESRFVLIDQDGNGHWSSDDKVVILKDTIGMTSCYEVILTAPDSIIVTIDSTDIVSIDSVGIDTLISNGDTSYVTLFDTTYGSDTTYVTINHPEAGDVFVVHTFKPFNYKDKFVFVTQSAKLSRERAKDEMDNIAVVPNPYVVAASWEPQHYYISGRGTRKIDFIHLPAKCTIKIFTIRGYLVATVEHDSPIDDGAESWNLISKDGMEVAYGIYIYHVDAPGVGEKIGKFAVIK